MKVIDNPELSRLMLDHLTDLYNLKKQRDEVHLSTLIYCLTRSFFDMKQDVEPTDMEVMLFALGIGLQNEFTPANTTLPVIRKDGVVFSPDFVIQIGEGQYCEMKTTRMSTARDFPSTWIEYIKGGCYMQGIKEYDLSVLYMMGCLAPSVRVLRSDLTWDYIGNLKPGDVLVGVDEYPAWDRGQRRKLRQSVVLRTQRLKLPSYLIGLDSGETIIASEDHLWLENLATGASHYAPDWVRTDRLRAGSKLRRVCQTWEVQDSYDAGYLAGSIDSEGCIEDANQSSSHGLRVGYSQKEGSTLNRIESLLSRYGFTITKTPSERTTSLRTTDMATALKLLGSIRPKRLLDEVVWEGISLPQTRSTVEVTSLMPIGETEVVGLDTTTKTLVSEGVVSHNSYKPPFPQLNSFRLEFDEAELEANWKYLMCRKEVFDEALKANRPPRPKEHCADWECKNCRFKAQCDAMLMVGNYEAQSELLENARAVELGGQKQ